MDYLLFGHYLVKVLPRMGTFERNSSYIFLLRMVEPIKILLYESRSMPQSFKSLAALIVAARGVP